MTRKGNRKPFASLPEKTPEKVTLECLKDRLELASNSLVGTHMVKRFGELVAKHDQAHNTIRVAPGEMLEEYEGQSVLLPMLPHDAVDRLATKGTLSEFFAHRELAQQAVLLGLCPSASPQDLWEMTAKPVSGRISKQNDSELESETPIERTDRLSGLKIATPESVGSTAPRRSLADAKSVPQEVVIQLQKELSEGFTMRESMVTAVCNVLGGIHNWMHPHLSELYPGQVVYMARSADSPKDWTGQVKDVKYRPVILTHHTFEERPNPFMTPDTFYALEQRRIARMTVEAYTQGAALSNQDLALLLTRSPAHVSRCLDSYQRKHGVLLPTTGTVLDMGSTLTHKKMAVELYLQGQNTTQIARRLFHTPQAIDNYLTAFNKIAMLYLLTTSDVRFIATITSLSEALVKEHLSLIHRYLPEKSQLMQYLQDAGVELPPPSYG